MKKRVFIVMFLFFVFANWNVIKADFSVENQARKVFYSTNFWKNFTKKELKSEIKTRKKIHRFLLEKYNENFEEKYFNLIKQNSLILTDLRKKYKK